MILNIYSKIFLELFNKSLALFIILKAKSKIKIGMNFFYQEYKKNYIKTNSIYLCFFFLHFQFHKF